jgi:hypothetical protein
VREHPDGQIFLSLFKHPTSFITAAEPLAEIGDCRGRDHPRAIRTVGRAWCHVVWRCWHDRTPL